MGDIQISSGLPYLIVGLRTSTSEKVIPHEEGYCVEVEERI